MSRLKSKYSNILKEQSSFSSEEEEDVDIDDQYDSGVIRCVCDDPSDDGFTIQCEHCLDWQHASCVNVKRNKIPKHYLCDRCSRLLKKKRPLDSQNRRKEIKEKKKQADRKYSFEENEQDNAMYQNGFTHTSKCIIKQKAVANIFKEVRQYWFQLNKLKTPVTLDAATVKGLESLVLMESNLLLPSIPKASVKPLRRSLHGSYNNEKIPSVEKGVFADIHIPEDRYLMEVTGELKLKSEYKSSNYFSLLGTPLRHVFFYRSLDAYVDARDFGNDARFIRRSCKPNSEIKSIILPNDNEDTLIHMGIYTTEELDKSEEVTIGWNWQRGFIMHKKYQEFLKNKDEQRKTPIEPEVRNTFKKILRLLEAEYGECACEDKDECFIEYIKEELETESDSETTEPKQVKRRRPGRPSLSESVSKATLVNLSDEELRLKAKKRTFSEEPKTPLKRPFIAKKGVETMKDEMVQPRVLYGKKKWLQLYLSEQKEREKYIVIENTSMEESHNYFSDASSESTLPLIDDDTREMTSSIDESKAVEAKSEYKAEIAQELPKQEKEPIKEPPKQEKEPTQELPRQEKEPAQEPPKQEKEPAQEPPKQEKEPAQEPPKQEKEPAQEPPKQEKEPVKENVEDSTMESSSSENKPATRVKLSIQEYLSMRRNLPTN